MRRGWVALVLVSALAAGACRKEEAPLRVAIHSAPLSLDPHLQNEVLTQSVLANLYDGLTEFDQESRIRPALAAEWRNPDDRTWVFRLRPGVRRDLHVQRQFHIDRDGAGERRDDGPDLFGIAVTGGAR